MIYFLIVNYYSTRLVTKLISSLPVSRDFQYKVLIINNSVDDSSINQLKTESVLVFDAEENLGFGRACNKGLKYIYTECPQSIVWIINPDAYLLENSLQKVSNFFKFQPEISILGTSVYTFSREVWFAGGCFVPETGAILTKNLLKDTDLDYIICDWVSGCSMIINLCKFEDCPQFDAAYFLYYEDFDFCKRYASQGHLIAVTNQIRVLHEPSSITNRYVFQKIKHSTYSYLLTLEKYTKKQVFIFRLLRLIFYAIILIAFKPKVAFGKIYGLIIYLKNKLKS